MGLFSHPDNIIEKTDDRNGASYAQVEQENEPVEEIDTSNFIYELNQSSEKSWAETEFEHEPVEEIRSEDIRSEPAAESIDDMPRAASTAWERDDQQ